jgi:hypothetical protein
VSQYKLSDIDALNKCCKALDEVSPLARPRLISFLQEKYSEPQDEATGDGGFGDLGGVPAPSAGSEAAPAQ